MFILLISLFMSAFAAPPDEVVEPPKTEIVIRTGGGLAFGSVPQAPNARPTFGIGLGFEANYSVVAERWKGRRGHAFRAQVDSTDSFGCSTSTAVQAGPTWLFASPGQQLRLSAGVGVLGGAEQVSNTGCSNTLRPNTPWRPIVTGRADIGVDMRLSRLRIRPAWYAELASSGTNIVGFGVSFGFAVPTGAGKDAP
ncbi:MAG: hypothetical protein AB8H79_22085 [Myxococcota bacterium]